MKNKLILKRHEQIWIVESDHDLTWLLDYLKKLECIEEGENTNV